MNLHIAIGEICDEKICFNNDELLFGNRVSFCSGNHNRNRKLPPYQYGENSEVKGLNTEIVNSILKELNMEVRIEMYPWAPAYQMVIENKNTLIYKIFRTQVRENLFKWVGTKAPAKLCLFALKEREDIKVETLEDA